MEGKGNSKLKDKKDGDKSNKNRKRLCGDVRFVSARCVASSRVTGLYSGKTDESRVTHPMTAVVAAASDLGTSQLRRQKQSISADYQLQS